MDSNLAEIHKNLPERTLFVVFLGSADTRRLRKLVFKSFGVRDSDRNRNNFFIQLL